MRIEAPSTVAGEVKQVTVYRRISLFFFKASCARRRVDLAYKEENGAFLMTLTGDGRQVRAAIDEFDKRKL